MDANPDIVSFLQMAAPQLATALTKERLATFTQYARLAEENRLLQLDVASHRAELCLAYDVIDTLPEGALEAIPKAKLLTLIRNMDETQKRDNVNDRMTQLVQENERLRDTLLQRELTKEPRDPDYGASAAERLERASFDADRGGKR